MKFFIYITSIYESPVKPCLYLFVNFPVFLGIFILIVYLYIEFVNMRMPTLFYLLIEVKHGNSPPPQKND